MNKYRKELLTPEGETYVATSPAEANNLIYGSGYREVDEDASDTGQADEPESVDTSVNPYAYGGELSP